MRRTVTFERRQMMSLALMPIMFLILPTTPAANATAIAISQMALESLSIVPASGSITFSSSVAGAVAVAQNPLEIARDEQLGPTVFAHAAVNSANASSFGDSMSRTGFVVGYINSLQRYTTPISAQAYAYPYDRSSFSITGTSGPVLVQVSASVPYAQSLATTDGRFSTSTIQFFVDMAGSIVLVAESDLVAFPYSSLSKTDTWNLSNSLTLEAGQTYSIDVGLNSYSLVGILLPEPETLSLFLAGVLSSILLRQLRR